MFILPFDTETTDMPLWKEPSDSENQPHLVQLAALLVNSYTREVTQEMDVIIRPDGWTWGADSEAFKAHGITVERAMDEGIPEVEALEMFMALHSQCEMRVAHNSTFDNRILRIALKRYMPDLVSDEEWKDKSRYYCTLMNAKRIMGGRSGHTLAEALKHFTGKTLEGAHNACADTRACLDVFFAICDLEASQTQTA